MRTLRERRQSGREDHETRCHRQIVAALATSEVGTMDVQASCKHICHAQPCTDLCPECDSDDRNPAKFELCCRSTPRPARTSRGVALNWPRGVALDLLAWAKVIVQ